MKATKGELIDFVEWIKQQKGETLMIMSENIVNKYGTEMGFEHLRLYPYKIPPPPIPPPDRNRKEGDNPIKPPSDEKLTLSFALVDIINKAKQALNI